MIENEIDSHFDHQVSMIENQKKQKELQQPISDQIKNMENPSPHPSQNNNNQSGPTPGDIMAYHGNEMGGSLSTNYSFLEDSNNSSLNNNFTFVGDGNAQPINTPKEFNDNNQIKSEYGPAV